MKTILLFILLFNLAACEEDIDGTKGLTPEEIQYLTTRAQTQCLAESKPFFDAAKNGSNERFYVPKAWPDDTLFTHTFKVGTEATARVTHKVSVWKSTATDVYFLINIDDINDEVHFLKVPRTTNDLMFDALQTKNCEGNKAFVVSTSARTYSFVTKSSAKELTQTFTFSADYLAFLGRYKETRKEQALDTAGAPSGAAVTMTGALASPVTSTRAAEFKTYGDYVARGLNPTLCLLNTAVYPPQDKCDPTGVTTFPSSEL